ncbi:MAG: phosphotransferase [Chloroflexi bacterium]|nr:phosphotransferase [Chloroflexota bacterium]MCI0576626.1 phosphotransferase [Chloroflexota bacterium]MCI0647006.1 phosphotransferase [Chloroflexota bacterium]MCI0730706.1 phosphotransferase [Chloroflexota bacterium]
MGTITVTRSFAAAPALAEVIAEAYDLGGPVTCKLISKMLRTQDNDHYLVTAGNRKYVARVYQLGKHLQRQESDYLWELDWLTYLKEQGQPVSYPLPRRDGSFLGSVNAPEGVRYYALFSFARGKPMSTRDEEELYTLGGKMAEIHLASNHFASRYQRQPMDLSFLVDRPVEHIKEFWANKRDEKLDILLTSAEEAKAEVEALLGDEPEAPDVWGPIGGDFHPYNTHFDETGQPAFFNFDLCGNGWRAYDIATFLLNADLMHQPSDLSEAFFAGYYSVRPLSSNEHEAVSPFLTIRRIWLTGTFATVEGIAGYTFIAPAQLDI